MKHVRVLVDGQAVSGALEGDTQHGTITLENGVRLEAAGASYLAPVAPRQIFATHLTYRSRCVEYEMKKLPDAPAWFVKPISSVSHHKANVSRPRGCHYLNYEGEIAVVIGQRCKGATLENALSFVRGYTIVNDFGVHDFRHADRGAMVRVKGQDGFCPMGPVMVDASDVDPTNLKLRTFVNGAVAQETNTGEDLMFSIAYQIADLSRLITLEANDVLLTGTPAHSRPVEIGDVVAVEVDGIGRLENTITELDHDLESVGIQPEVTAATLHVALAIPEDEAERRVAAMKESQR
jgi:5-oxopent-3-ene-1,2,5-tricarboxylate decarboxylase / 2-hydroxyhepta-2,4-diene-1,7-dioate isomerase